MKARFVYENLDFERGKDPKQSLKVGMWMEIEIQEIMERLVNKHGGSYNIERQGSVIGGTYNNEMFSSKGRIIIYNIDQGTFHFTFPGMGTVMEIKNLGWWEEEVDSDLTRREEEIKKLGYNPFLQENLNFERGRDPRTAMDIGLSKTMQQKFKDLNNDYNVNDAWMDRWQGKTCMSVGYDITFGWNRVDKAVKEKLGEEWFDWPAKESNLVGVRNYFVKPKYEYLFTPPTNEGLDFERGRDPRGSMGVGVVKSFMDFSEKVASGDEDIYNDPGVAYLAGGDAENDDYDQFVFEETLARELCQQGELLSSGKVSDVSNLFGSSIDVKYEIYKTKLGFILKNIISLLGQIEAYSCLRNQYDNIKKYFEDSYKRSLEREPHPDLIVDPEFLEILRKERLNETYEDSNEIKKLATYLIKDVDKIYPDIAKEWANKRSLHRTDWLWIVDIRDLVSTSDYSIIKGFLDRGLGIAYTYKQDAQQTGGIFVPPEFYDSWEELRPADYKNKELKTDFKSGVVVIYKSENSDTKYDTRVLGHELLHAYDYHRSGGKMGSNKRFKKQERFQRNTKKWDDMMDQAQTPEEEKEVIKQYAAVMNKNYYNMQAETDAFFQEAIHIALDRFKVKDYSDPDAMKKAYKIFVNNFGMIEGDFKLLNPSTQKRIQKRFLRYYHKKFLQPVQESVNFERSKDPKRSIRVGRLARGPELFKKFLEEVNEKEPYGASLDSIKVGNYFKGMENMKNHLSIDVYGGKARVNIHKLLKEYNLDQFLILPGELGFSAMAHKVYHFPIKPEFWEDFKEFKVDSGW